MIEDIQNVYSPELLIYFLLFPPLSFAFDRFCSDYPPSSNYFFIFMFLIGICIHIFSALEVYLKQIYMLNRKSI